MRGSTNVPGATARARTLIPSRPFLAVFASFALIVGASGSAAAAQPSASGRTSNVIVVLRNQHTDLGDRARPRQPRPHERLPRRPGAGHQHGPGAGAKNLRGFDTLNAVSATVTAAQASELAADPSVAAIYPDLPVEGAPIVTDTPTSSSGGPSGSQPVSGPVCPTDPSKPLLEPEALQVTNTAFSDPSTPQAQNNRRRDRHQGRLHRRRPRHQQPGLHPGGRTPTSSSTTRTSPATDWPPRPEPPRRSATPARSRPRAASPMTWPTT